MAAKAAALEVDQVMFDLEDAVAPAAKPEARKTVVDSLLTLDWSRKIISVRVNDVTTPWFESDVLTITAAAGAAIHSIVLPKVERPSDVKTLSLLLDRIERERDLRRRIGIEPQIESARGLAAVDEIAVADARIESLTFGPADFAASIGSPVLTIGAQQFAYPGHVWHYALARIVVAAKANNLAAIDGPYGALKDADGLVESCAMARALGCDGKWAIHPDQVGVITGAFTPSAEELARAERIAERYAGAAGGEGVGAVSYENELLDAASARLAGSLLRRGPKTRDP